MYAYVYMYMYVYAYMYICVHVYMYICALIYNVTALNRILYVINAGRLKGRNSPFCVINARRRTSLNDVIHRCNTSGEIQGIILQHL
jgi:hypothetical protein